MLVCIDGFDGIGKTTLCHGMARQLNLGTDKEVAICLKESFDADIWLLEDDDMLLELYKTRRRFVNEIHHQLERGCTVILDRFLWSTIAYHSTTLQSTEDPRLRKIMSLHQEFCHDLKPHRTFLFCTSDHVKLRRHLLARNPELALREAYMLVHYDSILSNFAFIEKRFENIEIFNMDRVGNTPLCARLSAIIKDFRKDGKHTRYRDALNSPHYKEIRDLFNL